MKLVIDLETNALINPTKIWVIVCHDLVTGERHIFRNILDDDRELNRLRNLLTSSELVIGHNIIGYDLRVLERLAQISIPIEKCLDTFIISKLVDYPRSGHSVEDYGVEFGLEKINWHDYSKYSIELENYCIRDVEITTKIYYKYLKYITGYYSKPMYSNPILIENMFQCIVNNLEDKGFTLDINRVNKLLNNVHNKLTSLDVDIMKAFPPRLKFIREVTPKETKYGTISLSSIPKNMRGDISELTVDAPFCYCNWYDFNPGSPKQVVEVLNEAGWKPVAKTKGHVDTERQLSRLRYQRNRSPAVDTEIKLLYDKLVKLRQSGYKVNEENLLTLPASAPAATRTLSQRIIYESRRKTLTEWTQLVTLNLKVEKKSIAENIIRFGGTKKNGKESIILNQTTVSPSKIIIDLLKTKKLNASFVEENNHSLWITITPQMQSAGYSVVDAIVVLDGLKNEGLKFSIISARVHGKFSGLGAWTHRMSHQKPNMANIPNEFALNQSVKLLGKELRQCWTVPKDRLLVGVDAEGIQLRIFAHLINDPEFTDALVRGNKNDKTDPHSLNQRILGSACKSRAAAKRFIYALLLGGGMAKLAEILECSVSECEEALNRLMSRYSGWAYLKEQVFPTDARRGWFTGLDGRKVRIPGDTEGSRRHLAMSGYLQNGEVIVIKTAAIIAEPQLRELDSFYVDIIHDEYQVETPNDWGVAKRVAGILCDSIRDAGIGLNLRCPLAGSYWNDDHKEFTIGRNWYMTH